MNTIKTNARLLPPFFVYIEYSDRERAMIGENLNYAEAIQMRFSWRYEMERCRYKLQYNSNRYKKENLWQECHIYDSVGKELK